MNADLDAAPPARLTSSEIVHEALNAILQDDVQRALSFMGHQFRLRIARFWLGISANALRFYAGMRTPEEILAAEIALSMGQGEYGEKFKAAIRSVVDAQTHADARVEGTPEFYGANTELVTVVNNPGQNLGWPVLVVVSGNASYIDGIVGPEGVVWPER